jgi:hypothetical protein
MARHNPRGVVFHLIWRFVDRSWFFTDDEDRSTYLRLLGRALAHSDWRCLAYALMSNHIHLCMVAGAKPMWSWTRRAHPPFVRWMNTRHGRLGSILADRAKDYAVLPANEAAVIAYIHNNPVRAGVVTTACESTWTSHRAYLGWVDPPKWLCVEEGLARCALDRVAFDEWVQAHPGTSGEVELEKLRRAARKRGGIQLASPARLDIGVTLVKRPFAHVRPDPRRVVTLAAETVGISLEAICSRRRSAVVVAGRRVAVHCGTFAGLTGSEMAAALGMSESGVSRISSRLLAASEQAVLRIAIDRLRFEMSGVSAAPSPAHE